VAFGGIALAFSLAVGGLAVALDHAIGGLALSCRGAESMPGASEFVQLLKRWCSRV
jgi:hypothetical protein